LVRLFVPSPVLVRSWAADGARLQRGVGRGRSRRAVPTTTAAGDKPAKGGGIAAAVVGTGSELPCAHAEFLRGGGFAS